MADLKARLSTPKIRVNLTGKMVSGGNVDIDDPKWLNDLESNLIDKSLRETGLPNLTIFGDAEGMSKDTAKDLEYMLEMPDGTVRSGACNVKWQGSSSLSYPKKNYTLKFDEAFDPTGTWGEHKKFVIKANWMDASHLRNISCARIWGEMVRSRTDAEPLLLASPNSGAVDGFPVWLRWNEHTLEEYNAEGSFAARDTKNIGLYTFNIPKDGWMANMSAEAPAKECILCADNAERDATYFWAHPVIEGDGTPFDYSLEYITDEGNRAWVSESMNALVDSILHALNTGDRTEMDRRIDWRSAIDLVIFTVLTTAFDMMGRNYLLYTYDGEKWIMGAYDMDSTFGLNSGGEGYQPMNAWNTTIRGYASVSALARAILAYKRDELIARYRELRGGILSEDHVANVIRNFAGSFSRDAYARDNEIWKTPLSGSNNAAQMIEQFGRKCALTDAEIDSIAGEIRGNIQKIEPTDFGLRITYD